MCTYVKCWSSNYMQSAYILYIFIYTEKDRKNIYIYTWSVLKFFLPWKVLIVVFNHFEKPTLSSFWLLLIFRLLESFFVIDLKLSSSAVRHSLSDLNLLTFSETFLCAASGQLWYILYACVKRTWAVFVMWPFSHVYKINYINFVF